MCWCRFSISPPWLVAGLLGAGAISSIYLVWEAVLPVRWGTWLACLALVAADVGIALAVGTGSMPFVLVNNSVLILVVVGATNLWAQGGMKARDAAVLGAGLVAYDFVARPSCR